MRSILIKQIVEDALLGDTTVLAAILSNVDDDTVSASLGDEQQRFVKELREFIDTYGTEVDKNEDSATIELMMDDHICIEFDGKEYYIQEDNSLRTEAEELLYEHLEEYNQL
jgi:hypothetical protein